MNPNPRRTHRSPSLIRSFYRAQRAMYRTQRALRTAQAWGSGDPRQVGRLYERRLLWRLANRIINSLMRRR